MVWDFDVFHFIMKLLISAFNGKFEVFFRVIFSGFHMKLKGFRVGILGNF